MKQLRKWEELQIKVKKAELDLTFLKNCQAYNVNLKFLAFNIPHSNRTDEEGIRKRLLKSAINRRRKEHLKLTNDLEVIKGNLNLILTSVDFFIWNKAIHKNCQDVVHRKDELQNLTKNEVLPFRNNEIITNLSNYRLSDNEASLLKNGLYFEILPANLIKTNVLVSFENMCNFLTSNMKDKEKTGEIISQLSHLANSYYSYYKPSVSTLKKHGILKRLRNNQEIVILRSDKDNGVVILNRKDYICGMNNIINDRSKFKLFTADPTSLREGQLQRFLQKLKTEGFFDEDVNKSVYSTGSRPARIYGLPKSHKIFDSVPA